jgi:hypothetical protein
MVKVGVVPWWRNLLEVGFVVNDLKEEIGTTLKIESACSFEMSATLHVSSRCWHPKIKSASLFFTIIF